MFTSTVGHITLDYRVDNHLIVIGQTTWQTRNLTAVIVGEEALPFTARKPQFLLKQPRPQTQWLLMIVTVLLGFTLASNTNWPLVTGSALGAVAIAGVLAHRYYSHKSELARWHRASQAAEELLQAWRRLSSRPVHVYRLILESSSGRAVALSAFNKDSLVKVHTYILDAMRDAIPEARIGSIATIDPDLEPIAKQYEAFCAKELT